MKWKAVSFDEAARDRIDRASAFEKRLRLEGLLGLRQKVGDFNLRPITPKDILELEFSENRLTTDEEPQLDDYVHFVWTLSKQKRFFKVRQIRSIARKIESSEFLQKEILSFFASSFNDMPAVSSNTKTDNSNHKSSVYVCSIVDAICNNYGWSLDDTLNTPMSTLLQLLQRSMKRNLGDKYSMKNTITQRARAKELNRYNSNG